MSNTITPHPGAQSPFDAIRRVSEVGTEYWSARELMPLLGYGADWRNFAAVIEKARIAAQNQGENVSRLFGGVTEKGAGRPREDFHLSRFACYLVAMNGDPRKPEVAAAQSYFAIRTREAETQVQQVQVMTRDELLSRAVLEATSVISELKPKADRYDRFLAAEGDWSVSETAGVIQRSGAVIGERRLFDYLDECDWTFRDSKGKWRATQYAKDRGWLSEKPQGSWVDPETGRTHLRTPQVRVTAKGADRLVEMLRGRSA